jgi:hypothetical protein
MIVSLLRVRNGDLLHFSRGALHHVLEDYHDTENSSADKASSARLFKLIELMV